MALYREFDLYAEGATQLDYIGHLYFRQGKIEEALSSFENALHVFTQAGNRQGEAAQLSNIGNIYFEQGRLDEALKAFGDALHVFQLIGHRQGRGAEFGQYGVGVSQEGRAVAGAGGAATGAYCVCRDWGAERGAADGGRGDFGNRGALTGLNGW